MSGFDKEDRKRKSADDASSSNTKKYNPYLAHTDQGEAEPTHGMNDGLRKGLVKYDSKTLTNPWTFATFSEKYHDILKKRLKLPVYQFRDDLLKVVAENQIVVVEGETGR
jgi:HrpA-like RNA helicase